MQKMPKANEGSAIEATDLDARSILLQQAGEKPKTGPGGALPSTSPGDASRQFLFEYRFGGSEWIITIYANDPAEAKEKIKAVALARYEGEVHMTIPANLSGFGLLPRLIVWWRNARIFSR